MLGAAERIVRYVDGMTIEQYEQDERTVDAVERCFTIVGEALVRLDQDAPSLAEQIDQPRSIRNFRNILVHRYELIDSKRVLIIAQKDVPGLICRLRSLLAELSE